MNKLFGELKVDFDFVKSHTLQPRWYKFLKVFLLVGFLVCYYLLFGSTKTIIFLTIFLILSALVHFVYRAKTKTWTQSWLDFIVIEGEKGPMPVRIGIYYYTAVVINAILALVLSQILG
jgi:hypothetical protein